MKPKVVSCIQPTSEVHIGNYFGAIRKWVEIQDQYDCIYGIVDYHAMSIPNQALQIRNNTEKMVIDLLVCGVDLKKSTMFVQSLIPEHHELAWILGCLCNYEDLITDQFKDKSEWLRMKNLKISTGLFSYPVLQAADTLIYKANFVPVGKDQEKNIDLIRKLVRKFNEHYGECFTEPQLMRTHSPTIMSLNNPTKKMSKSRGEANMIGLFEDAESITRKVRLAITDSGILLDGAEMSIGVANLFEILKASESEDYEQIYEDFKQKNLKHSVLKEAVAKSLVKVTSGFIEKRSEVMRQISDVSELIVEMSENARKLAQQTMEEVKDLIGFPKRRAKR